MHSVYKYGRRTTNSVHFSVSDVFLNFRSVNTTIQCSVETCTVQAQFTCILLQRGNIECLLIFEEQTDVFKKLSLCVGSIGGFCCLARVFVLVQRKIANYKSHSVAIGFQELFENRVHRSTSRALEVSKLNNCDWSIHLTTCRIVINTNALNWLRRFRYKPLYVCVFAKSRGQVFFQPPS